MEHPEEYYIRLAGKWANGTITQQEAKEYLDWYNADDGHPLIIPPEFAPSKEELKQRMLMNIQQRIANETPVVSIRKKFIRVAAAVAAILILSGASYFFFFNKKSSQESVVRNQEKNDVPAPNVARATLKTDDGRIIFLDSAANGSIATQGNVNVEKLANGQIKYSQVSGVVNQEVHYHTISNPRGSKVEPLTLIDGTQVWLNAESSITYPTAFIGNERKVTITGEADFVVTHNEKMPFKVIVNGTEIKDVGTEFNVNAYNDEPDIKVTLLEGSVRVQSGVSSRESVVIKPGEQAVATDNGQLAINKNVDLEEVMAWKNGKFQFGEAASVEEIMRQISRWYDVDVEYKGKVTGHIGGSISRNVNASQVLQMLEMTGTVKFEIEGKKVVVKP